MDQNGAGLLAQGNGKLLNQVVLGEYGLHGEAVVAPIQQRGGVHKAHDFCFTADILSVTAQDYGDEPPSVLQGGGYQAVAGLVGKAGLQTIGVVIQVAQHTPVGDKGVGGVQLPDIGFVGGGDVIGFAAADGHEQVVLHGLPGDEVDIPGGGIVVGIGQAVGVCKMGPLAAQLRGPLVHQCHKVRNGAGYRFGQNVGSLVGGNNEQAVEKLLHGQHFALLNAGGAAVLVNAVGRLIGGSDGLGNGQIPPVYSLQHQQRGHDLSDAGGVGLFFFCLTVEHSPIGLVHEQGVPGIQSRLLQRIGLRGQKEGGQKDR